MKTAIIHDYLSQRGGAERLTWTIAELLPDAPIFTSVYEPSLTFAQFQTRDVRTSPLQGRVDPTRFRRSALRFPGAFRGFELSGYDVVVVSSSAFAHHVRHPNSYVFCHTPPRFLYQPAGYVGAGWPATLASAATAPLRRRDRKAARRHVSYAANSEETARRIRQVYGRDAVIIHPAIGTDHLPVDPPPLTAEPRALVISRLLPYKRIDVAIRGCALAGIPLTVIGAGPERRHLQAIAGPGVTFLGRVADDRLRASFAEHSLVLVPGVEDFGMVPVEANYAGRPVVATASGGALETVIDGTNGVLVDGHDPADWAKAISEVATRGWSPDRLRATTMSFQAPAFRKALAEWLPTGLIDPVPGSSVHSG
jgi:glycosyltransferase involved in cell wall biosynthesis